jgi:hypothetical protein
MKLTVKQQMRIDILSKYIAGEIFANDAKDALEVSERHFRRLVKNFREQGIKSIFHGNKGTIPHNKTSDVLISKIIRLYRGRYQNYHQYAH